MPDFAQVDTDDTLLERAAMLIEESHALAGELERMAARAATRAALSRVLLQTPLWSMPWFEAWERLCALSEATGRSPRRARRTPPQPSG
jgi:hypothetical protein